MILFNDVTSIPGATMTDALAYVENCNIKSDRVTMEGVVSLSLEVNEPNYAPYTIPEPYFNVPYDANLDGSPASQFYSYLMTLPKFSGGIHYP